MCDLPWQAPVWDRRSNQKHRKSNKRTWDRSMTKAMTAAGDETSQFDPNLSDEKVAMMELECVQRTGAPNTRSLPQKDVLPKDGSNNRGECRRIYTIYLCRVREQRACSRVADYVGTVNEE
jgi:hypothetical protein